MSSTAVTDFLDAPRVLRWSRGMVTREVAAASLRITTDADASDVALVVAMGLPDRAGEHRRDPSFEVSRVGQPDAFPRGPGRTTNPTDFGSLMDDLEATVFGRLSDETWFYPGHGDDSTLGKERGSIPEWRARGW
jgi:hypothetical protein